MCLSFRANALKPVHLLHLVQQVAPKPVFALHLQDILRDDRAVRNPLPGVDPIARLDVQVLARRDRVLALLADRRNHLHLAHALARAAKFDDAVDVTDDCRRFRLTRLEKLSHARQTARDVLRLAELTRRFRQQVTGPNLVPVAHHHVRLSRDSGKGKHLVRLTKNRDLRVQVLLVLGDHAFFTARVRIDIDAHRHAFDHALQPDRTGLLGNDRHVVGVPPEDELALAQFLVVLGEEHAARRHAETLLLLLVVIQNPDFAAPGSPPPCRRPGSWPCAHC